VRQALRLIARGAKTGATVGLLLGPVLGGGCGLLFFPALIVMDLIWKLFIGTWGTASGGWDGLAGLVVILPIAATVGAVIGVVPGVVIGTPVGAAAALLRDRRTRAVACALLGAALSLLLVWIFPFAGVLFVLSGAIGGWLVAVAVEQELRRGAFPSASVPDLGTGRCSIQRPL
jgi:hypothetical protein